MKILNKIKRVFSRKTFVQYGGFEMLSRLTSGTWSKGKMLEQYEKSLYVFACVYKIAEKVASTSLELFQILNSKGDVREIQNHPALDLLFKVNPFQTKSEFLKITMINKKLCGDAFWFKVRNDRGQVVELWNLRPDYMEIIKDPNDFIKAYKFNKTDGTTELFDPDYIVHFKYPTPLDDFFGTSPIKSATVRIDTENYAGQYQRDFFLNNARPDGFIKVNAGMAMDKEQKDEIRHEFEKKHKGVGKNSKLAVIEGDIEYQQVSISQREMDYIESMKFTRDDILVAFGVPKAIVAITDDVNRANAETSMHIFLSEVIKPELTMLVEKINEMLIIPDFGDNLYLDFIDPTPENREQVVKEYETGIKNGYLLINEVRARENLEPINGGWSIYKPLSEVVVGGLSKGKAAKHLKNWEDNRKQKEADNKLKIFRGRNMLLKKFLIKEKLVDEFKKAFKKRTPDKIIKDAKENTKKESDKKEIVPLIKGDIRDKYAELTIKVIDQRADRLKSELNKLAQKQSEKITDIISKLDLTKAIGKDTKKKINDFYKGQQPIFAEFIFPFIDEFTRNAGLEAMAMVNPDKGFEMTASVTKTLQKRSKEFGLGVNNTTREKITNAINAGIAEGESMIKISDRIESVYKEFPTWRSDLIARTESTAANNEGFIEAYKQSDVATHKEWIAVMDDRTRDEHAEMDGEIVPVGKAFSNGLQYPQEPNCRCVIGPAFEK